MPAILSAFLASFVEVVEAFTIVLAVSIVGGWRPALMGTGAAFAVLAIIVLELGPVLNHVPFTVLQLVIGVLLLLFGLRWLRKAILRSAGVIALHDEAALLVEETEELQHEGKRAGIRLGWLAGITALKAVLLEGLEVVFIVLAVGAGRGLLGPASIGALAAFLFVMIIGAVVHRPLSRVPENTLKSAVGIMLSAFGVFWTGEGIGIPWPSGDFAILVFAALFLLIGIGTVLLLRRSQRVEVSQ